MRPSSIAAAGVAAVVVATGIAAAPVSTRAAPAAATQSGIRWTQLSSGSLSPLTSIALARFNTDLQVVWTQAVGAQKGLYTRIVSAVGTPETGAIAVLPSPWEDLNTFPAIVAYGGGRMLTFSGLRTGASTPDPYSSGYQYYLTSPDGKTWTLADGTISANDYAYGSYGTDATVVGGQPVVAYTAKSASSISYHQGIITPIPDAPATDPTTSDGGNDAYDTGLGTDTRSTQTWAVWFSISGARAGVHAQRILPTLGPLVHGPQSVEYSDGSYTSIAVNERIVVAERSAAAGGGLYAGYAVGYPTATHVALWRLGSNALVIPAGGGAQLVGTAAGPGGRVWLYWWDANTGVIDAVRTNPGATRFGAVTPVPTPKGSTSVWDIEGDATNGPLQLVVNSGSSQAQVYSTVVEPDLTVSASPASLDTARAGTFTVTVSDAGSAAAGATVRFAGRSMVTGRTGRATFSVAKGTKKGRYPVVVTDTGYAPTTTAVTLH